jgi:hypothetical protein
MRDFYAPSKPAPLDQAHGLRRLFAGQRQRVLPLAANPHVPFAGLVLDRLAAVLAAQGHQVLVVDAAEHSPAPHELAMLDLAVCIECLSPRVSYLPARGLPLAHVDTRGCAGGFIDALQHAAPRADVILLHAEAGDLARLLMRRSVRPLLLGADHPESIKHAYGTCKLLAQRCNLMTFDLLLAAEPGSPRLTNIASSLAHCADGFLGALLHDWASINPGAALTDDADHADHSLARLLSAQMNLDDALSTPGRASRAPSTALFAAAQTRHALR